MLSIFRLFIITILIQWTAAQAGNYSDVRIIQKSADETVYELSVSNFNLSKTTTENGITFTHPDFDNAVFTEHPDGYTLPARLLQFIVPENGNITVQILSKSLKQYNNITLKQNEIQQLNTVQNASFDFFRISPKIRFRDMMQQTIQFNPLLYNPASKSIILTEKIVFKVSYSGIASATKPYRQKGRLDNIYKSAYINFEQAKNWQIQRMTRLSKTSTMSSGPFYMMDIEQDGLYKITASTLDGLENR